jgi:hypothetical protein
MKLFGVDLWALSQEIFYKLLKRSILEGMFRPNNNEQKVFEQNAAALAALPMWQSGIIYIISLSVALFSWAALAGSSLLILYFAVGLLGEGLKYGGPYVEEYLFKRDAQAILDEQFPVTDTVTIERTLSYDSKNKIACYLVQYEDGSAGRTKKRVYSVDANRKWATQVAVWKYSPLCPTPETK